MNYSNRNIQQNQTEQSKTNNDGKKTTTKPKNNNNNNKNGIINLRHSRGRGNLFESCQF